MDIDNYVFIQLFFIEIEEEVLVLSKKIIASFCMFLVALSIGSCGKNEKIDDTLDATIESLEEIPTTKQQDIPGEEEDSLESDLFDLIDSMYENREDGE